MVARRRGIRPGSLRLPEILPQAPTRFPARPAPGRGREPLLQVQSSPFKVIQASPLMPLLVADCAQPVPSWPKLLFLGVGCFHSARFVPSCAAQGTQGQSSLFKPFPLGPSCPAIVRCIPGPGNSGARQERPPAEPSRRAQNENQVAPFLFCALLRISRAHPRASFPAPEATPASLTARSAASSHRAGPEGRAA